jgi:hypothetical protein
MIAINQSKIVPEAYVGEMGAKHGGRRSPPVSSHSLIDGFCRRCVTDDAREGRAHPLAWNMQRRKTSRWGAASIMRVANALPVTA